MNKKYQFTFNEIQYREKMELLFDLSQKLNKSRVERYIVFIALSTILGGAFLYFNSDRSGIVIGPLLFLVAIAYAITLINYLMKAKQYKAFFNKHLEDNIDRLNESDGIITFAFSDEDFHYHDHDVETTLKWKMMKSFLLFDTHLFLIMDDSTLSGYTLSAFDLSNSEFEEICNFVETKLPPHHLTPLNQETNKSNPEILDN